MRAGQAITGIALLAATALGAAPQAFAEYEKYAINGTYYVVSNGEWATQNDRYQDEPSVRSTWDISTTCSTAMTCSGKVTSSLGWTEDIYTMSSSQWFVHHYVQDWIPCPDGTTAPGLQVYRFYPSTESGNHSIAGEPINLMVGEDSTTGVSGNCGRNKSLVLTLPVKMTKVA